MSFGPVEAIVVVVIVLVIFGAGRLSGVGKALGTGLREFRQEANKPGEDGEDGGDGEESNAAASTTSASQEDKS